MVEHLLWSLIHRPYVTLFLFAFVLLSWLEQGGLRTLYWTLSSYAIALLAEWASINYGIPFGRYVYHYDVLRNDLIVFGVPFFDTVSFTFLSYISYSFALFFLSPLQVRGLDVQRFSAPEIRQAWPVTLLGAFLMLVIDVIVDPVANLGKYWFLGDIYHYVEAGIHYGVNFSNYGGWFVVGCVTMRANQWIDRRLTRYERAVALPLRVVALPGKALLAPCFWCGVVLFQLGVTYWLAFGDTPGVDRRMVQLQALTGSFTLAPVMVFAWMQLVSTKRRKSEAATETATKD